MTIAIPVDDKRRVIPHTGRAAGFLIYRDHTSPDAPEFIRHDSPHHQHQHGNGQGMGHGQGHGHGHHNHGGIIEKLRAADVELVIALGMGPRLEEGFCAAGIDVMYTRSRNPEAILEEYRSGDFVSDPRGSVCKGGQHHH